MNFELKTLTQDSLSTEKCDALVVLVAGDAVGQPLPRGRDACSQLIGTALKAGDFEAKTGKWLSCYRPAGFVAVRVILVGAGDATAKSLKSAVGAAIGALKGSNAGKVVISLSALPIQTSEVLTAVVVACGDAGYIYETTKPSVTTSRLQTVVVAVADAGLAKTGFDKGVALVKGMNLAKEWANRPANYATPSLLATAAKALGKHPNIKVEVLGPKEVAKLGMGSFAAVAMGSSEPLRFIVLRYSGADKTESPTVLVGKGITFDTGGISIKPAAEMDEMKFDMCGAASVLGVFRTLADLKPPINVIGLIPACENMPDGRAVKPGDVVTSMSGQTIEILNTDAEGRLVLCDALTYAERFKPKAVIDIATLTGACVVALGGVRSGLFSGDSVLTAALLKAGETSLDLCWHMPLDDEYAEGLKTNFADVANIGGRAGGAITAAKFLQRFASKFPWAHLDIAGTAWKSGVAKGATARPVALLVDYLLMAAQANTTSASTGAVQADPSRKPQKKKRSLIA
jgi:leucyl aminopeptidase